MCTNTTVPDLPRNPFIDWRTCVICKTPYREQFSLKEEVWAEAGMHPRDFACLECVTKRLGRPLLVADHYLDMFGAHVEMGMVLATINSIKAGVPIEELERTARDYWATYRQKHLRRLAKRLSDSMHDDWKASLGGFTVDDLEVFAAVFKDSPPWSWAEEKLGSERMKLLYHGGFLKTVGTAITSPTIPGPSLQRSEYSDFLASLTKDDLDYLREREARRKGSPST